MSKSLSITTHPWIAKDPIRHAISELISAQSALNMEPSPQDADGPYLSDRDKWAAHAYEHIAAAIDVLSGREYKPRKVAKP